MQTRDLDEAIGAVTSVYCPHTVRLRGRSKGLMVQLDVSRSEAQPLVRLSYNVPVEIDAGSFPRLFLMMHCAEGTALARQDRSATEWRKGQTVPFSAGLDSRLSFDRSFTQTSLRLDVDKLESLCACLLGRPLEDALRFELRPFSADFERLWQDTLSYLWRCEASGFPLRDLARASFDEFLLTLLLHHHPHNYSEDFTKADGVAAPRLVREAERYMTACAEDAITISAVAAHLGLSVRTLQAGFREHRAMTPSAALRTIRLRLVRKALVEAKAGENVTAIAMRFGFDHLGRFGAYYRAAFGEPPSMTLRRNRRSR